MPFEIRSLFGRSFSLFYYFGILIRSNLVKRKKFYTTFRRHYVIIFNWRESKIDNLIYTTHTTGCVKLLPLDQFLSLTFFIILQCIVVSSFQRQCICWLLFPRNLRHWRSDLFSFVLQRSKVSFREPAPRAASGNDSCYSRHATVCTSAFAAGRTSFPPVGREHFSRMHNTSWNDLFAFYWRAATTLPW